MPTSTCWPVKEIKIVNCYMCKILMSKGPFYGKRSLITFLISVDLSHSVGWYVLPKSTNLPKSTRFTQIHLPKSNLYYLICRKINRKRDWIIILYQKMYIRYLPAQLMSFCGQWLHIAYLFIRFFPSFMS